MLIEGGGMGDKGCVTCTWWVVKGEHVFVIEQFDLRNAGVVMWCDVWGWVEVFVGNI